MTHVQRFSEEVLRTWLCVWALQPRRVGRIVVPDVIRVALVEEGWIEVRHAGENNRDWSMSLTGIGRETLRAYAESCGAKVAR